MPVIEQVAENVPPQPIVLDGELARRTTRKLVGKLEAVALIAQVVGIAVTANIDKVTPAGRNILLGLAGLHLAGAFITLRTGGPFLRGGPFVAAWVGSMIAMPVLMASLLAPGEYGASPACVQLCAYPAPPLVLFAFYPWLSAARGFLRPGIDILLVAAVILEPLILIWQINGYITSTNGWAVANAAIINVLGYTLGRAIGKMCRTAAEEQLRALRQEYHRLFHYLHGQTENSLAAIGWHYTRGREDLVLEKLRELGEAVSRERLNFILTDDMVSLSHIFSLHARTIPAERILVRLPKMGGVTAPRRAAILISDALGDLLKNVLQHADANTVTIGLGLKDGVARISVKDDGVGFNVQAIHTQTTSLQSLRRLLQDAGGDLTIASRPGAGTNAVVMVPIRRSDS